ncbi:phage tail family protein [Wukongibacter sp. M2B1]|uniref:phage tail family protein n=1 Tax=Wukongibacter sp. M2B1 TaxID=3088895 RepID=UPI003D799C63
MFRKKIIYRNSSGAEIELTNSAPLLLNKLENNNNVNIYSSKGIKQDGNTYLDNTLDIKEITIEMSIVANSVAELNTYKDTINRVFNPKLGKGYLIYSYDTKERKIKCIVNKLPYFSPVSSRVDKCLISLTANDPYWFDLNESKEEIALWLSDFHFPLEIPADTGIEMGHRAPSLFATVNNNGDVETGMIIIFRALATVENPSLFNVNTREQIKINKIMSANEVITVDTNFNSKKIESTINSTTTDAFNYFDFLNSTFLQLKTGENIFRFDADNGIDNLEVDIYYTNKYLGV